MALRTKVIMPLLMIAFTTPAVGKPNPSQLAEAAIRTVFANSVAAWNGGDIDGFMASYERSQRTIVVGSRAVTHGYNAIRSSYAPEFAKARSVGMNHLSFEILEFQLLDPAHAFVIGRYSLRSPNAGAADETGLSSLVFTRTKGGWRITSDHS